MEELERRIEESERKTSPFKEDGEVDLGRIASHDGHNGSLTASPADGSSDGARAGPDVGGGHDQEPLLGGATSFTDGYRSKDAVRVFPKTGSALIFQQRNLFHGGDDVFRGVKYTARTDVMYRRKAHE
ncbi:uncharacterized protein LDX57_006959 [Aspergillus melleus]|uniref:uncharacterized protein n=1 Tax=Aspergillus melleus TaxID=138277 RepID=UPI001E8D0B7B|nr:uncharacterized protein LDX57_006959 [Aspergillus melleus]KAH8429292.1 hypothetical protein LDX57_006959 [Aspergillus melleus]